jgi:putative ABC transport system substrate-binding protein
MRKIEMKRREFIAGLGMAATSSLLWPLAARAQQQAAMPVVGYLSSRSPGESETVVAAFRKGLAETGHVAGQNVTIDYRWAEGQYDRLPALAAELVDLKVAVILAAGGPPSALAAKKATSVIPIVFSASTNPVGLGLIESLGRPGGNITGMSGFSAALGPKRFELLHEMVPLAKTIGLLINPANPLAQGEVDDVTQAAKTRGIELVILRASTDDELEIAFARLTEMLPGALIVAAEPFFDSRRAKIVALVARAAIPASYGWRENVAMGGLMSYGTSLPDSYRQAGVYVGRVLKGEKPANLPVMQPTKFEFVINFKTARTLGLVIPPALLIGADEVIE